jgi:hypothetical protein
MTSAYPTPMDDLITQAQQVCRDLGVIPSQNKLKAALHVRAERARAVLHALKESGFDPTQPPTDTPVPRRLHAVEELSSAEFAELTGTLPVDSAGLATAPVPAADPQPVPGSGSGPIPTQVSQPTQPVPATRPVRRWPVILLAAPAFVAIWSGWVGVGALTGFGPVHPLPGIASGFTINSAITLPIGVETYAAYALRVWLSGAGPARAQRFAKRSAIAAFMLGGLGQIAYHLMSAAHLTIAPWPITTIVSCLPVVVLGFGAALGHLQNQRTEVEQ